MAQKASKKSKKKGIMKWEIIIDIIAVVISIVSLFTSWCNDRSQDEQWKATFDAQSREITILESSVQKIGEQNEVLSASLDELSKQNEILTMHNDVLKDSLDELKKINEISERSLEQQLLEKGIQCRISYLCCSYDSFWVLFKELEQEKLLIVDNELTRLLDFDHIENSDPYDYPASYVKLREDLGGVNSVVVVMLKIDLTSNDTVLTQDLALNLMRVNFQQVLPVSLSKLSMYSMGTGLNHFGDPVDMEKYQGTKKAVSYSFSDQLISNDRCTTILCPVMIQAKLSEGKEESNKSMLTTCTATYKIVDIPLSVTFRDIYSDEIITKSIRDINDSVAITEYNTVVGYG